MARVLTNKQLLVVAILRDHPDGLSAQAIADEATRRTPCPVCGGSGEGEDVLRRGAQPEYGCGQCYGRGTVYFAYPLAYQALKRLRSEGLATRRCKRDEWGDELAQHIYLPAESNPDDPLERLYALPAAAEAPDAS